VTLSAKFRPPVLEGGDAGGPAHYGRSSASFEEALERYRKRRLTADEAGKEVLGMSGRNFRRMVVRYDEEGG